MGLGQYLFGLVLTVAALVPLGLGAVRLRSRCLPGWDGAPARVAEAIAFAALLLLALELVGVLGLLTRAGVVAGCALTGAIAWAAASRVASADRGRPRRSPPRPLERAVAACGVAAVGAAWFGWVIYAYRHGMQTPDTLWYHLPFAARFAQTGSILHLYYTDSDPVVVFYSANAELFHTLGIVLFRSDLLSPAINLAWAALALAAAWAIGRPTGREPHCLLGCAIVLATPGLVDTQPGGGYNDAVCIALLLAAGAMLVNGGARLPASAFAAAAAGLALGTKFTMIVPTLMLAVVGVALARRGERRREAAVWVAGLLLLGGYWYVRNLAIVGNPLPSLVVHLGPLSLPSPHVATPSFTVGQYLTNFHVWRLFYLSGFRRALGPVWWAILALAAIGCGAALVAGGALRRGLAVVSIFAAVSFLVTPQFLGLPGIPLFFFANVRYIAPALALALMLVPLHQLFRRSAFATALLAGLALMLVITLLDGAIWPTGIGSQPFSAPVRGTAAIGGALLAAGLLLADLAWRALPRGRLGARAWATAIAAVVAVVVVGGWRTANSYAHRRYAATAHIPEIYAWAQTVHHQRIGIVGLTEQYPLYGRDSSNYVQYVGEPEPHHGFAQIASCRQWRVQVDRGHYGWLVLVPPGFPLGSRYTVAPQLAWTVPSPVATEVISEHAVAGVASEIGVLVRISGQLDPDHCPRA